MFRGKAGGNKAKKAYKKIEVMIFYKNFYKKPFSVTVNRIKTHNYRRSI